MNVINFDIEVKRNLWTRNDVEELIILSFKKNTSKPDEYEDFKKMEWENFPHKYLKEIYNPSTPIIISSVGNNHYYLFKTDNFVTAVDRITLQVLIVSNTEDIDNAVNTVLNNIKETMNKSWCVDKITRHSVKVLRKNCIYIYPFNNEVNDIWNTSYKIKATFSKVIFDKGEKIQLTAFLLLTIVLWVLYTWSNFDMNTKSILLGIFPSCLVFVLTMLAAKAEHFIFKKYHVSINNLANIVEKGTPLPFSSTNRLKLRSPQVPQKEEELETAATLEKVGGK